MSSPLAQTSNAPRRALTLLAGGWVLFQVVILFLPQPPLIQRPLHLSLALTLFFLATTPAGRRPARALNLLLSTLSFSLIGYYLIAAPRLASRMEAVDPVLFIDLVCGSLLVLLILEAVRRCVGWALLGAILAFLSFGFLGRLIPGWTASPAVPELFKFSGFTLGEAIESFTMTPNGLLGVTTYTSMSFVFYFVLFGAVYAALGGSQLFIDLGLRAAGRQRGGPAKAAVISSSLMGSISGSAVANVATTGLFTIPLMRRAGYPPARAAAIEAIASTGGQLMPPIMGVAAFVMAELLQKPYATVALAGVIPALAFYASLLLVVHLHASPHPAPVASTEVPPLKPRLHLLLPLGVLIALLAAGWSANLCAVGAILTSLIMAARPGHPGRLTPHQWAEVLRQGTLQAARVAIPIAAIGLIVEVAVQSGLVLKFSLHLLDLGQGALLGALLWIVLGCLVMGMGLPTVAAYVLGATLFVPAMLDMGVEPLAAHFFVMYYCVLSMITPPVALASYTAAGLADAPVTRTCFLALRLSLVAFIIPFAFLFNPALLGQGPVAHVILAVSALLVGGGLWAFALEGTWGQEKQKLRAFSRVALGGSALLLLGLPLWRRLLAESQAITPQAARLACLTLSVFLLVAAVLWSRLNPRSPILAASKK